MGLSCEDVVFFNFKSESELDVYEDTIADIEDVLRRDEVRTMPESRTNVTAQQNAKLPKLQLRRFYEDAAINVASLRSMGYDEHVMCLVEETMMKLPRPIRYELTKDDRSWTKWDFTRFLWIYLKTCEEIEPTETSRFESSSPSRRQVVHATTTRRQECVYCRGGHKAFECTSVSSIADRKAIVQSQRQCYNGTRNNHTLKECQSRNVCYHCKGKHHSSICTRSEGSGTSNEMMSARSNETATRDLNGHIQGGPAAYQTVIAIVGGQKCRILLDGGSGKSYISREHGRKIAENPVRTEKQIIGTVNGEKEVKCPVYNLEVAGVGKANKSRLSTEFAELDLYMLTSVPNAHPERQREKFAHLNGIWFSDVSQKDNLEIHAILAVKDYAHIRTGHMIEGNNSEPMAEETVLEWTLMGTIQDQQSNYEHRVANLMIEQPTGGKHVHYLPHHAVIRREAETTKLSIVYDCSAKEGKYDKSMNHCLHIGPPLQPVLYDNLIRFRMYPVALLGDIQQAFLQIKVDKEDRDAMRFLWPTDLPEENAKIQELRLTRAIFGSAPSPFLLGATIRHHMENYKHEDPEFVDCITKG
eukprot:gene5776-biopygen4690